MFAIPRLELNDGNTIPQLGFGVFRVPNEEASAAVTTALEAGYRLIDTAAYYRNEIGTGQALSSCAVPRENLYVTTKVWHTDHGYDATLQAFDQSLTNLQLDYLDLYLIHWPAPAKDNYVDTWRALEKLKSDGRIRSIGVSNFNQEHLERLVSETSTVPAVNQIELHPNFPQANLREFNAEQGIVTQAWSPLGHGQLVTDPAVSKVAQRRGKSPAQVLLRWNLDLGNAVIFKSVTPERIRANTEVFDFELSDEDRDELSTLDNGVRTGPDPELYGS